MSQIPFYAVMISDGVVIGARSMRLMELFIIICACTISAFVGTHASAPLC